jgi:hypothetical protein
MTTKRKAKALKRMGHGADSAKRTRADERRIDRATPKRSRLPQAGEIQSGGGARARVL